MDVIILLVVEDNFVVVGIVVTVVDVVVVDLPLLVVVEGIGVVGRVVKGGFKELLVVGSGKQHMQPDPLHECLSTMRDEQSFLLQTQLPPSRAHVCVFVQWCLWHFFAQHLQDEELQPS